MMISVPDVRHNMMISYDDVTVWLTVRWLYDDDDCMIDMIMIMICMYDDDDDVYDDVWWFTVWPWWHSTMMMMMTRWSDTVQITQYSTDSNRLTSTQIQINPASTDDDDDYDDDMRCMICTVWQLYVWWCMTAYDDDVVFDCTVCRYDDDMCVGVWWLMMCDGMIVCAMMMTACRYDDGDDDDDDATVPTMYDDETGNDDDRWMIDEPYISISMIWWLSYDDDYDSDDDMMTDCRDRSYDIWYVYQYQYQYAAQYVWPNAPVCIIQIHR